MDPFRFLFSVLWMQIEWVFWRRRWEDQHLALLRGSLDSLAALPPVAPLLLPVATPAPEPEPEPAPRLVLIQGGRRW